MIQRIKNRFVDAAQRTIILRGVNLPAKKPAKIKSFYEGKELSYVGRPWPLEVAEKEAARLKSLGMNLVRLCVPWEAVMHDGPGELDEEYLSYIGQIVAVLEKNGIYVNIDPHQDVFSRFSGGSGAPKWIFELAGLIPENFYETVASITQYEFTEVNQQGPYPYLFWQTNLSRLAAMTIFTLFWAGDIYAPKLTGLQNHLQEQYMSFVKSIAERVKHNKNILGIATMNELSKGYIGNTRLNKVSGSVKMGAMPTPLQGFALADGKTLRVTKYGCGVLGIPMGSIQVNAKQLRVWRGKCIWKEHGVWDYNKEGDPIVLKKEYFATPERDTFANDFYTPFAKGFYREIRKIHQRTHIILETQEFIQPPNWDPKKDGTDVLFEQHFYDPMMTSLKWYQNIVNVFEAPPRLPFFGKWFIDWSVRYQLFKMQKTVKAYIEDTVLILRETGVAMALKRGLWGFLFGKSATETGNYQAVVKGADRLFQAIEACQVPVTLWNYDIFNTLENGDNWNNENFSIYCSSLANPLRGQEGWQRPYPMKTPGIPGRFKYDRKKQRFQYSFTYDAKIKEPLEIYLPDFLMKKGYKTTHSPGNIELNEGKMFFFPHTEKAFIRIQFGT